MNKTLKFLWINLLWFLFSIPVITFGGSTSAALYVFLKLIGKKDQEGVSSSITEALTSENDLSYGEIYKLFVKSFKENFVQGIAALIFSGVTMGIVGFVWYKMIDNNIYNIFVLLIVIVCSLIIVGMNCYIYSMIAHYKNTFANFMKNTIAITFTFYKWSLKMSLFVILELSVQVILLWLNPILAAITLLFWPQLIFFVISYYSARTFDQLDNPPVYDDDKSDDDESDNDESDDDKSDDDANADVDDDDDTDADDVDVK